jgi:hypothetical protein
MKLDELKKYAQKAHKKGFTLEDILEMDPLDLVERVWKLSAGLKEIKTIEANRDAKEGNEELSQSYQVAHEILVLYGPDAELK